MKRSPTYPVRKTELVDVLRTKDTMTTREISDLLYPDVPPEERQKVNHRCRLMLTHLREQGCVFLVGYDKWHTCVWSLDESKRTEAMIARDRGRPSEAIRNKVLHALDNAPQGATKWQIADTVYGYRKITTDDVNTLTRALNDLTRLGMIERWCDYRVIKWKRAVA